LGKLASITEALACCCKPWYRYRRTLAASLSSAVSKVGLSWCSLPNARLPKKLAGTPALRSLLPLSLLACALAQLTITPQRTARKNPSNTQNSSRQGLLGSL